MLIVTDIHRIVIVKPTLEGIGIDNEDRKGENQEYDDILLHSLLRKAPLPGPPIKVKSYALPDCREIKPDNSPAGTIRSNSRSHTSTKIIGKALLGGAVK